MLNTKTLSTTIWLSFITLAIDKKSIKEVKIIFPFGLLIEIYSEITFLLTLLKLGVTFIHYSYVKNINIL